MNIKKEEIFKRLLCYGLFPERLIGIVSSKSYGDWVLANNRHLNISRKEYFSPLSYKLTRNNNSPRFLSIPHPLGYVRLCRVIYDNWEKIQNKLGAISRYEDISMIIPKVSNKNKRLISMASYDHHEEKERLQLAKQFGKKYFVQADISDFYPSIYTHIVAWVLVGKVVSKATARQKNLWYNKLDTALLNMQDAESKGLPIGPDTSGIVAELVLSNIDESLKKYDYMRFIDDYKCYCKTKEEAENFIRELSFRLEEYRLKLNTKKTRILELPQALTNDWVRKLKQYVDWEEVKQANKDKVLGFMDLSSELFRENPEESSIRYAAKVLKSKKYLDYSSYMMILNYFLNLCFLFPYVIDICDDFLKIGITSFPKREADIKKLAQDSITKILIEHVRQHRSDVITWSLFLAIKYRLTLYGYSKIVSDILRTQDCIPALMLFLYIKINRGKIDEFIKVLKKVDQSEWWLFIYEVSRIEGLRVINPMMEKARRANISFLDQEITNKL